MTPQAIQTNRKVREYLDRRAPYDDAAPTPEEVRRQMGWDLIPENRQPGRQDDE